MLLKCCTCAKQLAQPEKEGERRMDVSRHLGMEGTRLGSAVPNISDTPRRDTSRDSSSTARAPKSDLCSVGSALDRFRLRGSTLKKVISGNLPPDNHA